MMIGPLCRIGGTRVDASCILVDSAHSFHIKGFGVDWCASTIVMGCRKGFFGRGSLDAQLERAYGEFQAFCAQQRKPTCCDHWSKLKMDMTRNTDFPSSIAGKGFDTAVCCGWLEHFFQDKVGVLLNFQTKTFYVFNRYLFH